MKKRDRILLFIPAYNCEKQVVRVLSRLQGELLSCFDEIIVVNNRSTDGTEEAVLNYRAEHPELPLKLLRNDENYGLGGSHKVAFRYMLDHDFDAVMVLHGDDQGNPEDFLPVLKSGLYRKYDCVLGARFMRGSKLQGYSAFRTLGNIVYDFLFAAVLRRRIYDLGSGLNLYRREMLETDFYHRFPDNLTFNYCMVMALSYYGQKCRFYPVSWRETDQVSNVKMTSQAISVLAMLWKFFRDPGSITGEFREKIPDAYRAEEIS